MSDTEHRNRYICQDYKEGTTIQELARSYGLGEKRVKQILDEFGVDRRPRNSGEEVPTISRLHSKIGMHLYLYRDDRGVSPQDAANDLGVSVIKLRRLEQGRANIEILDLLAIAAYTKTTVEDLIGG